MNKNERRVSKPELYAKIERLDKEKLFMERYLMEKGLYDEAKEYVEKVLEECEELPFA